MKKYKNFFNYFTTNTEKRNILVYTHLFAGGWFITGHFLEQSALWVSLLPTLMVITAWIGTYVNWRAIK